VIASRRGPQASTASPRPKPPKEKLAKPHIFSFIVYFKVVAHNLIKIFVKKKFS
jgi:hypothetical protein